ARAPLDDVLAAWAGLGYYSRARNLKSGAQAVTAKWSGALPQSAAELRQIPGIGRYTAGAIASIAFGRAAPLVDGNVARVLARLFAIDGELRAAATQKWLWQIAGDLVKELPPPDPAADRANGLRAGPPQGPGDFNQALMELGATVCL